jgi:hypothetical protein
LFSDGESEREEKGSFNPDAYWSHLGNVFIYEFI